MKDKRVSETIRIKSFGTGVVNGKMTAIGIPVCVVFDCANPELPFLTFHNWFLEPPEYTNGEEIIDPE